MTSIYAKVQCSVCDANFYANHPGQDLCQGCVRLQELIDRIPAKSWEGPRPANHLLRAFMWTVAIGAILILVWMRW